MTQEKLIDAQDSGMVEEEETENIITEIVDDLYHLFLDKHHETAINDDNFE